MAFWAVYFPSTASSSGLNGIYVRSMTSYGNLGVASSGPAAVCKMLDLSGGCSVIQGGRWGRLRLSRSGSLGLTQIRRLWL